MLNILRTFQLGFHRFLSLDLCSTWNRRDCDVSTASTAQNDPNAREICSRAAKPPARHALARQHGNRGCARAAFLGEITTKAQMVPHFSFVHRNRNWNISFILHYWQRTILMLTLVACSYASISCHCLSSEIWRLFSSGGDMNSKWNNCHESCMIFFLYRYSVFKNQYSIAKQYIAILMCIDIFLHP